MSAAMPSQDLADRRCKSASRKKRDPMVQTGSEVAKYKESVKTDETAKAARPKVAEIVFSIQENRSPAHAKCLKHHTQGTTERAEISKNGTRTHPLKRRKFLRRSWSLEEKPGRPRGDATRVQSPPLRPTSVSPEMSTPPSNSQTQQASNAEPSTSSGTTQPRPSQTTEEARKDRTLAEFLLMLDDYEPLVTTLVIRVSPLKSNSSYPSQDSERSY